MREEYDPAITAAQRWLDLDPLHEPTHRQLMRLYAWSDQHANALRQYRECERILKEEVGVGPDAATVELFEAIKTRQVSAPFIASKSESTPLSYRGAISPLEHAIVTVPQPETPSLFVGRHRELARLDEYLHSALSGHGQIVFVTGEAGAGKTALVGEFVRRAQENNTDLLVTYGNCNAQTGLGDPYLPFRELLAMLTGDASAMLSRNDDEAEAEEWQGPMSDENVVRLQRFLPEFGRILVEKGPELIDRLVSGSGVVQRADHSTQQEPAWFEQLATQTSRPKQAGGFSNLDQNRIFEQFTAVVQAIAVQKPLILILDDLHWMDVASANLLFHLARRIGQSRLFLIGAYRPEDIIAVRNGEQHPLQQIASELKRQEGDVWIDLNHLQQSELRVFIDGLVDSEPNRLDRGFRQSLLRHTGGHALFTVELLRSLQEQGDLIKDETGYWFEAPSLDSVDPNLAFLAIFSRDCRDFGVIYSDFGGVVHFSWIDRFTLLETERTFIFSDFAGSQRENGLI
ncbi:DUF2791 family P-loop domain-containing protein [Chloroflexi bacterium TSY]|nr:DUF2791 family P-loop domain-containing protein [Chloroflexi bacterium TSY]